MSHDDDVRGAGGVDPNDGELVGVDEVVSATLAGDFPCPVDWLALSAVERRDEVRRLWPWVVELVGTWPVSRDVVPPCWYRHESLIRILSAARDAYLTAYHPSQAASAAADWMHMWDAAEERLRRWVSQSGCKSGEHRPNRIQRWVGDHDEAAGAVNEFEAFVADDFDRRSAQELREAVRGEGLEDV
jgi:hypothetical protein